MLIGKLPCPVQHQGFALVWIVGMNPPYGLETAFNANADYIITHNIRDFKSVTERFAIKGYSLKAGLRSRWLSGVVG
ncbi:MAG: hypothetical protein HOP34_12285 [Methylococcaceae bacterium]|nr:hypothetical protein [Methylococcaceae bacterium]